MVDRMSLISDLPEWKRQLMPTTILSVATEMPGALEGSAVAEPGSALEM
jgi:hypothetical protein